MSLFRATVESIRCRSALHFNTRSTQRPQRGLHCIGNPTKQSGTRSNRALLLSLQSSLSVQLLRSFRSPKELATDLVPYLNKMLMPDIKPVIVGGGCDQ